MKKTSTRLASLGGFVLLGACAIALAQRDSRKRESEPLEFTSTGQSGAQLIQVDSDWSPPYGKQNESAVVRANNDDRTSYTLSDSGLDGQDNPLRGAPASNISLPPVGLPSDSKIQTASHTVPLGSSGSTNEEPTATVRLASGEAPSDPPAWALPSAANRYPNPGSTSNALPNGRSALPPNGVPSAPQNQSLPGLPNLPGNPSTNGSSTAGNTAPVVSPRGLPGMGLPASNGTLPPASLPTLPQIGSGSGAGLPAPASPYPSGTPALPSAAAPTRSLTDNASAAQQNAQQTNAPRNNLQNASGNAMASGDGVTRRGLPTYGVPPRGTSNSSGISQQSRPEADAGSPQRTSTAGPTGSLSDTPAPPARNSGRNIFDAPQSRVSDLSDTQRGAMSATDLTQRPSGSGSFPSYGGQSRQNGVQGGRQNQNLATANWPPNGRPQTSATTNPSTSQSTPSIPSLNSRASFNATSTANRMPDRSASPSSIPSQEYSSSTRPGTSAQLTGLVSNRPGDRYLDGSQNPIMLIQKRAPEEIRVGKPATFVIAVRNAGNAVAHGVTVLDSVPSGSKFVESTPPARPDSQGMLTWKLGEIAAGEEQTIKLVLVPQVQGEVGSVATVHFAARASVRTVATMPKLELELQTDSQVLIGDRQEIQVVLRNVGTGMARGIRLEADIPEQLKHESGDTQLEAVLGDLRPSESRQITLNTAAVLPGRSVCNIRAIDEDGVSASEEVRVDVKAPNLVASIQGPKLRYLERQATYKIAVQNNGTATATNLQFVARLPAGLKFNAADIHGQYDPNSHTVRWGLHELPAGQTAPIEVTVLPVELGPQVISFDATADLDISTESKAQVVVDGLSELAFSVGQDDGTIEVGAIATYSVQIANVGNKADGKVELSIELPPGAQLVSVVNAPVEYRTAGNQIVFAPIQEIRNKDKYTFRFQVKHTQAGKQIVRTKLVSANWPTPVVKEEGTLVYDDNH